MTMTLTEAKAITGHKSGLGKPSKMPGYSTAIPAQACRRGAQLAKIPGSVCSNCYALRGNYLYKSVREGLARRMAALDHPRWVEGMARLIGHYTDPEDPYFRGHDAGDFQSQGHIEQWIEVAWLLPWVNFWIPSKEIRDVKAVQRRIKDWPANLVIRLSAPMIGKSLGALSDPTPTSTVDAGIGHKCPAPTQGNKCGPCRACWDPTVSNIDYHKH